jgi:DedD protein
MAFFKFRKGGDDKIAAAAPPESVEAMRKRAKHRLIGSAILVLIGVIGFPLLVDKQPRPIDVNIPIEIPDKDKVKPLAAPAPVAPGPVVPAEPPSATAAGQVGDATAPIPAGAKPAAAVEPKPVPKPASKPVEKAAGKAADKGGAEKAASKPAAAADERFVVQVGAFSEVTRAREARLKLERAGLKTYTQVLETKEGRRIRVRVGPFTTKAQADKAVEKIKKLDLPAAVLTL